MNNDIAFNEQEYYSFYKKLRNKFRKYNSRDIIDSCVSYLYKPEKDKISQLQKHPWLVVLLIKWVILDDDFDSKGGKKLTSNAFLEILQYMRDLGAKTRLPTQFEHTTLFMRCISYQQFIYQHEFSFSHLSRQKLLFGSLPSNHYINKQFKAETGLEISVFLELVLVVLTRFMTNNNSNLQISWFDSVSSSYSKDNVTDFLNVTSITLEELRKELKHTDDNQRRASEYYEQTPFIEHPLIRNDNNYISLFPILLYRSMEHFIYDRMRKINAAKFMDKFGEIFERYIENTLIYSNSDYINEKGVTTLLGHDGNLIDFIVKEDNANIFIDAKAVEMSYSGKVAHLSQVLKDKTSKTVIKAIQQAHDVLRRLDEASDKNTELINDNNYLLVVTFKDLCLGNGRTFYESTAKDKLDEIYKNYSNSTIIPLENMYFISIEQFDVLSELVNSGVVSYSSAIEKAKVNDSDPLTKKFDFWLHLSSWGFSFEQPQFLKDEGDKMFDKLKATIA
jgi:hypothetical protein